MEAFGDKLSDDEAYLFAKARFDAWDFNGKTERQNTNFAFCLTKWITLTLDHVGYHTEVEGQYMPDSLKPLLSSQYMGERYLNDYNKVWLTTDPEFDYIPPYIPKWEELETLTFAERLKRTASDPSIYQNILLPQINLIDAVAMHYEDHSIAYESWGLDFKLNSLSNIELAVFGTSGKTWSASQYLLENYNRPRILLPTMAELAVVAAGHCDHRVVPTIPVKMFDKLDLWLDGKEKPPINTNKLQYPHGLKEHLIEELLADGILPIDTAE